MCRWSPLPVVVAIAVGLAACAPRPLPPDAPRALLYRDLERLVTLTETAGWGIDRLELEAMLPEVLDSVCRIDRAHRTELLAWVDAEIARAGGRVEDVWRARGKKLSRVGPLLTMTRVRAALDQGISAAEADCPFWLEPDGDFAGRQVSDRRWQLGIAGGGKAIGVRQGGRDDINFGGGGRLIIGRVFDMRSALYTGLELGGSASFPKDPGGARSSLVIGMDLVVPLIYRYTLVNTYVEGEAGWLGTSTEDDLLDVTHGMHVGAAVGARAARAGWFFPGAALGVSWERTFPREDEGAIRTTIKVGLRVAFDIDL